MKKSIGILVLGVVLSVSAFSEEPARPGRRPNPERQKERLAEQIKLQEIQLQFDKLRLKYSSATQEADKKAIVAEAKTIYGQYLDEQKAGFKRQIEEMERRLKEFDDDKAKKLEETEKLLTSNQPLGGGHHGPGGPGGKKRKMRPGGQPPHGDQADDSEAPPAAE